MELSSDLSQEVLKLLYIFSFSLGLWTCVNISVNRLGPAGARQGLILLIAVLLVIPVNGYLGLVAEETFEFLASLGSTLTWCYGPLILILINSAIKHSHPSLVSLLHFVPFAAAAILHFSHLEWLAFEIYILALLVQLGGYLASALNTLYQYRVRVRLLGKEFKNSAYYWMLYLVAGLFAIAIYDTALMFMLRYGVELNFYFISATACAFSVYISTVAVLLVVQPDVFSGDVYQEDHEDQLDIENKSDPVRYVELNPELASELNVKLNTLMAEHKPFLDPDISLAKLASLLGVTTHQLSELLNIHMETRFYDFLNHLRFEEAVRLMEAGKKNVSVTDIAYMSGFNNRNSFYKVFRKMKGLTPGEYRKQFIQSA